MFGRCAAIVTLVAWCAPAFAEAPVVGGRLARSIGRAGVGTASDDGGGALLNNPAALARRETARFQLGVSFVDDEMYWLESNNAPAARDQSSSRLLPLAAVQGAIGDWVVGAGVMTSGRSERLLRRPGRIPPNDFGNTFEYRYAGLLGSIRRDTLTLGGARRLGDTVAIGISIGASRVTLSESRRLWAGDANRIVLGTPRPDVVGYPSHDVELGMAAVDSFVPSAVAGVLVAPADSRIELAASASWVAPARTVGEVVAIGTDPGASVAIGSTAARLEVEQPVTLRTGVRWLGERWIAELGGDLWVFPRRAEAATWGFDDVRVIDRTTIGSPREAQLTELPSRISSRTHGALRAALDVELVAGFLWATGGYAYTAAGTARARISPTFGDLGGHTMALGLEGNAGGFTITIGWARTWSIKEREPVSLWQVDNPFGTGDGPIPDGTYDGSTDMIGISIDAELFAPD